MRPGPRVTAIRSTSLELRAGLVERLASTGTTFSRWCRDAISGTTPPKRACSSACEETTLAAIRPSSVTSAAAVSSQEVSSPRITRPAASSPAPGSRHMISASSLLSV